MSNLKHNSCPLCNSKKLNKKTIFYKVHGLIRCKICEFVFMENIPTNEMLHEHYSDYSYATNSLAPESTILSYHRLLDSFEKYRQNNLIIDYGCGRGWFLDIAKQRGWDVLGIEYSDKAIEINEQKGIKVYKSFNEMGSLFLDKADIITSFEVIEHFSNPHSYIKDAVQNLRKNGLFYVTTPNFNRALLRIHLNNRHYINYPEHLNYYSRKTIKKLFIGYNFKKLKTLTTGISITKAKPNSNQSLDYTKEEKIRDHFAKNKTLVLVKYFINILLSKTGLGVSLKAYFIKK